MKTTDFATASTHLHELLGIDLKKHLSFSRESTLKASSARWSSSTATPRRPASGWSSTT